MRSLRITSGPWFTTFPLKQVTHTDGICKFDFILRYLERHKLGPKLGHFWVVTNQMATLLLTMRKPSSWATWKFNDLIQWFWLLTDTHAGGEELLHDNPGSYRYLYDIQSSSDQISSYQSLGFNDRLYYVAYISVSAFYYNTVAQKTKKSYVIE